MSVFDNKQKFFWLICVIAASMLILGGCARRPQEQSAQEGPVVARINSYRMTASDFKDGVNFILAKKYLSVEPNQAKSELLDELITRNVLLQQAQKQNLDKEKAFMKEIEKYWEQSLLKLLLKKKSEEILAGIDVQDSEVISEYARMKRRLFAQLVALNEQQAAEKLSKAGDDKFDQVKENLKEKIVSGESPGWWILGDLPQYLEEPLFSLKVGQIHPPVKSGNNWVVIRVLKEEELGIEPYKNLSAAIRKNIQKRKKEAKLDQWIKDSRKRTIIKVNKKALEKINLE